MKEFKQFRRKGLAEMRPVSDLEVTKGVQELLDYSISISQVDIDSGSPCALDMIARNPNNHQDQWLVSAQYFHDNFEPKETIGDSLSKGGSSMNFGQAIHYLKEGFSVAREGWNGKGMYVVLMDGYEHTLANTMTRQKHGLLEGAYVTVDPYIVMKTALGTLQPGWLASQSDMLANDWVIVYPNQS